MQPKIKIMKDGALLVTGNVPLSRQVVVEDRGGTPIGYKIIKEYPLMEKYALCRCGKSKNAPFCDGSHINNGFKSNDKSKKTINWKVIDGQTLTLYDANNFCYGAAFCHLGGGTWNLIEKCDKRLARELAIKGAMGCPSGRLVIKDKETDAILEPEYPPSIVLLEEEGGILGPIWVRGNILIESSDAEDYPIRNRVTLCKCGKSQNMPFCDGRHYY